MTDNQLCSKCLIAYSCLEFPSSECPLEYEPYIFQKDAFHEKDINKGVKTCLQKLENIDFFENVYTI